MAKTKTSIALDARLLQELDERAKAEGVSRSELMERIIEEALADPPGGYLETMLIRGRPTEIHQFMQAVLDNVTPIDEGDQLFEYVQRIPCASREEYRRFSSRAGWFGNTIVANRHRSPQMNAARDGKEPIHVLDESADEEKKEVE